MLQRVEADEPGIRGQQRVLFTSGDLRDRIPDSYRRLSNVGFLAVAALQYLAAGLTWRDALGVPRLADVESWATVHHLVSTVAGRLRPGLDGLHALGALAGEDREIELG